MAGAIRRVLRDQAEVNVALDGAEAIRRLVCHGADAILAEVAVCVPGGEPFVTWLERSMPTWLPRLVLSSGGNRRELTEHFLESYQTPTLFKPYDIELLETYVGQIISNQPPRVSPFERTMGQWSLNLRH